jgi:hypothetical protein
MARGWTLVMPMQDDDSERAKGEQGRNAGLAASSVMTN